MVVPNGFMHGPLGPPGLPWRVSPRILRPKPPNDLRVGFASDAPRAASDAAPSGAPLTIPIAPGGSAGAPTSVRVRLA